ncbi:transposase, partial [Xanthomonas citri]
SKKFFIDSKLPHSWLFFARIPADPQLVANLVILHNVEQMTRVLAELREEGSNISPDVLAGLSPYRTSHINRFGDYTLDLKRQVEPIDFSRRILAATTR